MGSHASLRVLHVSEVHWGGVVTLLNHFRAEQDRTGHEVALLAPAGPPQWEGSWFRRWGIDRRRPATVPSALRELHRTVEETSPDVVHLHSFVAGQLGRFPGVVTGRRRVPVVYQPHAWSTDLFPGAVGRQLVTRAERSAAARTDLLVANCDDEIEHGRRLGIDVPGRSLGVAVDLHRFCPPEEARTGAPLPEIEALGGRPVVLALGRVGAYQKGHDLLVAAWEREPPADAVLVLVGPGDPAPLAALAPTQWDRSIRVFGDTADVCAWLARADVLVLPSRYETVGLVVAEAMAMGVPVVATAVDGVRATVTGGPLPAAGAVVEPGDMTGLLDAVTARLHDPGLRRTESEAARARAEVLFRPETVAARLEDAYREAIEMSAARSRA